MFHRRSFLALISSFVPSFLFAGFEPKLEKQDDNKLFSDVYKLYNRIVDELNNKVVKLDGGKSQRYFIQNDPSITQTTNKYSYRECQIATKSCNRHVSLIANKHFVQIYVSFSESPTPMFCKPLYESTTFNEDEIFDKMSYYLENAMEVLQREMSRAGVLI